MAFEIMIKKLIILDRDSEILAVTQWLQRLWDTMMSPPGLWWCWPLGEMPSATPAARTRSTLWTSSRTWENWLHHSCMALFHRGGESHLIGLGKTIDCCSGYFCLQCYGGPGRWTVYGLWSLSFEAAWSVLRYNLFILLGSLIVLTARLVITMSS